MKAKEKRSEREWSWTPRQIVAELDKYIVGQAQAKRVVAIALRNRIRRRRLAEAIRNEVTPKNILLIGPTGVGKTEIARRLAALVDAPFIKVEASKYTEVGYVGRDVESMIRDLVHQAVNLVREERYQEVRPKAEETANERLLDLLLPPLPKRSRRAAPEAGAPTPEEQLTREERQQEAREKVRAQLHAGELENETVEFEGQSQQPPLVEVFSGANMEELGMNIQDMMQNLMPGMGQPRQRRIKVAEARRLLIQEELHKMVDMAEIKSEAIQRVEEMGIIFIDELDKVAGREQAHGPDVSREGVQRDLLPIVEGTTVNTKHGEVRTDHILFIAAGSLSCRQALGSYPGTAGAVSAPGGVDLAHGCGFQADFG